MENKRKTQLFKKGTAGQSLVETAIVLPVLLLMLLGVFEVGWALRGYLFLVNVNRESTRFASRGVYLDFSEKADPELVGYNKVISHSNLALSNNLGLDYNSGAASNGTMIATYYTVKTDSGFACPGNPDCSSFDCTRFDPSHANYVAGEDLSEVEYPLIIPPTIYETDPNLPPFYNKVLNITNTTPVTAYHYHVGAPNFSRIDPAEQVVELRSKNNQLNCQLRKKKLPVSDDNVIVIEHIFMQDQISGLFSWVIPNPVPFYSHTAMRVNVNIREEEEDTTNACGLSPIIVPTTKVQALNQGDTVTIDIVGNGNMPGNFSFVQWQPGSPNTNDLEDNFDHPENAGTDYEEPDTSPPDTELNVGDWIKSNPGASAGAKDKLEALVGTKLVMPVWIDNDCTGGGSCSSATGTGNGGNFRVWNFVVMELITVNFTGDPKSLEFKFSHFNPSACIGDDVP